MAAEWKPVVGFESLYSVSDSGDIKNSNGERLKPRVTARGYCVVLLSRRGERKKSFSVHRLVMAAFVGPSSNEVNHKNGIKSDNWLSNLEYSTRSENMKHAYANGLTRQERGENHRNAKLTNASVAKIRQCLAIGMTPSQVARMFEVNPMTIYRIRDGKAWSHVPGQLVTVTETV